MRCVKKDEVSSLRFFEEEFTGYTPEELKSYIFDEERAPGDKWMEYGPLNYIPNVEVEVLDIIKEIP